MSSGCLIVKLAAAGDVLLSTALARALRAARPNAHIAFLTSAYAAPLLENNPDLDEILLAPVPTPAASPAARLRAAARMLALLRPWTHRHPRSHALVGHRSRALAALLRAAGLRVAALDHAAMQSGHRLDWQRTLLRRAGLPADAPLAPRLCLTDAERAFGESLWQGATRATCRWVFAAGGARNPWSAMPNRLWPSERWLALAARARRAGIALCWIGAAGDAPAGVPPVEDLTGRLALRHSAAALAAADLLIGHDSLPLVLAHALARPALGLYGPTAGAAIHAPGQPLLQGFAGCGPCYDPRAGLRGRAYTCPHARCMERLTLDAVWARAAAFLSSSHAPHPASPLPVLAASA